MKSKVLDSFVCGVCAGGMTGIAAQAFHAGIIWLGIVGILVATIGLGGALGLLISEYKEQHK